MLWNCSYSEGGKEWKAANMCSGIEAFIKILEIMYVIWFLFYFYLNIM